MGICVIVELFGVKPEKISRVGVVRKILDRIILKAGLHCVASPNFYQFEPWGVSAVYLLRESHVSIHTWPEYEYAALDIFTCGEASSAIKAFELAVEEFKPERVKKQIIKRGVYEKTRGSNHKYSC